MKEPGNVVVVAFPMLSIAGMLTREKSPKVLFAGK